MLHETTPVSEITVPRAVGDVLEQPVWANGATWHWHKDCVRRTNSILRLVDVLGVDEGPKRWFACHRCALIAVLDAFVTAESPQTCTPTLIATVPMPEDERYRIEAWQRSRDELTRWAANTATDTLVVADNVEQYAVVARLGPWAQQHASRPWWCFRGEATHGDIDTNVAAVALCLARDTLKSNYGVGEQLGQLIELSVAACQPAMLTEQHC